MKEVGNFPWRPIELPLPLISCELGRLIRQRARSSLACAIQASPHCNQFSSDHSPHGFIFSSRLGAETLQHIRSRRCVTPVKLLLEHYLVWKLQIAFVPPLINLFNSLALHYQTPQYLGYLTWLFLFRRNFCFYLLTFSHKYFLLFTMEGEKCC